MSGRSRVGWILGLTSVAMLLIVPGASAYVDGGSTAMIFQAVVAAVAALGVTLKLGWSRIRSFFSRHGDSSRHEDEGTLSDTRTPEES